MFRVRGDTFPLYCLQIYEKSLYLQTKRAKKAQKWQKTSNASEKDQSSPGRLAVDVRYLFPGRGRCLFPATSPKILQVINLRRHLPILTDVYKQCTGIVARLVCKVFNKLVKIVCFKQFSRYILQMHLFQNHSCLNIE